MEPTLPSLRMRVVGMRNLFAYLASADVTYNVTLPQCEYCGEPSPTIDTYEVSNSAGMWRSPATECVPLCNDCAVNVYHTCPAGSCDTLVHDGEDLCRSCDEYYLRCDDCGELIDPEWDDYYSDYGTVSCCRPAACDDDYGRDNARCADRVATCAACNTYDVHMELLTERFVCDHEARELLARNQPVILAHPLPGAEGQTMREAA
jgi:hypothetical protein